MVSLYGGLGNQLFQYSAARSLALRNGVSIILDLNWFEIVNGMPNTTPRRFALKPFGLDVELQNVGLPWHKKEWFISRIKRRLIYLLRKSQSGIPIYSEKNSRFDFELLNKPCPLWLDGYWQSYKYFDSISDVIRSDLGKINFISKDNQKIYNQIVSSQSICLHVRRGDYVTNLSANKTHGLCTPEYYQAALKIVCEDFTDPFVFIFSDDPEWVRKNLRIPFSSLVVDINSSDNAHQDLWLMSSCKRFVIANSSLSWWGAWLGQSPQKKVIAPKDWFLTKKIDSEDLFPPDWIRV